MRKGLFKLMMAPSLTLVAMLFVSCPHALKLELEGITNVVGLYHENQKYIEITWDKPDFEFDTFHEYVTKNGEVFIDKTRNIEKDFSHSFIENKIEPDGSVYECTFSYQAEDGHYTKPVTCTVVACESPRVTKVTLDRTSMGFFDDDLTVGVTLEISNAKYLSDSMVVGARINEGGEFFPATVDKEKGIATAKVTLPRIEVEPAGKRDISIYGIIQNTFVSGDSVYEKVAVYGSTSVFIKSIGWDKDYVAGVVNSIYNLDAFLDENSKFYFDVSVRALSSVKSFTVQMLKRSSEGMKPFGEALEISSDMMVSSELEDPKNHRYRVRLELPAPTTPGEYSVAISSHGSSDTYLKGSMYVREAPKLLAFDLPKYGSDICGKDLWCFVDLSETDMLTELGDSFDFLTVECDSQVRNARFTKVSKSTGPTKYAFEFTAPALPGKYPITLCCGRNTITADLEIADYGNQNIGDIIMSDGSSLTGDEFETYSGSAKPVAVVAAYDRFGRPMAMGLNLTGLHWVNETSDEAFNSSIKDLEISFENEEIRDYTDHDIVDGKTFYGNISGIDSWEKLYRTFPNGQNFDVIDFAHNYGTGWFIPSINELYRVYLNKDVINETLGKISGASILGAQYWSCSTSSNSAYYMNFSSGEIQHSLRAYNEFGVMCIKYFD